MSKQQPGQEAKQTKVEQLMQLCQQALTKITNIIPKLKAGNQQFIDAYLNGEKIEKRVLKTQEQTATATSKSSTKPIVVEQTTTVTSNKASSGMDDNK